MPAILHQIPGGMNVPVKRGAFEREFKQSAQVLLFLCEDCGRPAAHGVGSSIRAALATGDLAKAGKWYCGLRAGVPCCKSRVDYSDPIPGAPAPAVVAPESVIVAPAPAFDLFGALI